MYIRIAFSVWPSNVLRSGGGSCLVGNAVRVNAVERICEHRSRSDSGRHCQHRGAAGDELALAAESVRRPAMRAAPLETFWRRGSNHVEIARNQTTSGSHAQGSTGLEVSITEFANRATTHANSSFAR